MGLLKWAAIFAVLAIIAGALSFGGLASGFADIAKILFFLFVAGVVLFVILGVFAGRKITGADRTDTLTP